MDTDPAATQGRRSARARRRNDAGSAVQAAVITPVVLAVIFAIIQVGFYYWARTSAMAAAQEAVHVARVDGGTDAAATARASQFIADLGNGSMLNLTGVSLTRSATEIRVTVTGRPAPLSALLPALNVSQTAAAPVERFTAPGAP